MMFDVEARVRELGRQIAEASSSPWWRPRGVDDRILAWVVDQPGLRTQLFRFVDVFPATADGRDAAEHLREYLAGTALPRGAGLALDLGGRFPDLTARLARAEIRRLAHRFIAAEQESTTERTGGRWRRGSAPGAVDVAAKLWRNGSAATVDLLGEKTLTAAEADAYAARVVGLLDALVAAAPGWPTNPRLDHDRWGPVPRVNVSVKPTALCPRFEPLEAERALDDAAARLARVLEPAGRAGAAVHLDVEADESHELTYQLLRRVGESQPDAQLGCVVQAYRRDALTTLEELVRWARRHLRAPLQIRLVKGAYWDQEVVVAAAHGWRPPVETSKESTDASFERCARVLIDHAGVVRPLVGTHNIRSIAYALAWAERAGLAPTDLELQLLYGMAPTLRPALVELGYRTRVYTPVGDLEEGMAYLVRRLLENTSNESFVRRRELDRASLDELLRPPRPEQAVLAAAGTHALGTPAPVPPPSPSPTPPRALSPTGRPSARLPVVPLPPFANEPPAELRRPGPRNELLSAVDVVRAELDFEAPVTIAGERRPSPEPLLSVDPGDPDTVVCRAGRASAADVEDAMAAAQRAWPGWARRSAEERADLVRLAADELRAHRASIAALIAFEAGKPLPEADADVCEAIDFCEYYAREALALATGAPVLQAPGEVNRYHYQPRGVGVVISPWNFPLAIPTGMVAAALVTGNAVLFKPAEQTPGVAWQLVQAFWRAGVPPAVLAFLPGLGEEAGAAAVAHPGTAFVAFVGSRDVGRLIVGEAARSKAGQRQLPRVIAELGGKNAIVVDGDADLDVAIPAIVSSAFGYAGQKCSAASRLIVVRRRLDEVTERLVGATRLLPVGHPTDLSTVVGPLIDDDASKRVRRYQELARRVGRVLVERTDLPERGWYAGPMAVLVDDPAVPLARDEIFGPLLTVLAADDLDEALRLANDTEYALTGGFFSRSPAAIRRVTSELRAGNVYVNRGITGALVGRQPFGGYGLSGVGSKAGGPDYLRQFVDPRVVTENTLRQGFVPDESDTPPRRGAP